MSDPGNSTPVLSKTMSHSITVFSARPGLYPIAKQDHVYASFNVVVTVNTHELKQFSNNIKIIVIFKVTAVNRPDAVRVRVNRSLPYH
ncbi:hypothetical protein ALP94_02500 [Pseudomonas savastanoi pv. glycinea]|nr:hypothetical protein ALP94_02500 [Pseudomonas savastanoi pv. glycinea]